MRNFPSSDRRTFKVLPSCNQILHIKPFLKCQRDPVQNVLLYFVVNEVYSKARNIIFVHN